MKKFWNKNAATNEIFIYGDIVSDKYFESEITAQEFLSDFKTCGSEVTLHINSNGGDCFVALSIANIIKSSGKFVTVSIDGICASAATLIACSGNKIKMAKNALMMIHLPSVYLFDSFDAVQLEKIQNALAKIESSIVETYKTRTNLEEEKLSEMIKSETWLTAAEAKEFNFIDEITDAVSQEVDNNNRLIIFNSVALKKNYFAKAKEKIEMENNLLEKFKNWLEGEKNPDAVRQQELKRVQDLQALKTGNAAVNAIIDTAISQGATAAEISKYVEAVAKVKVENNAEQKFLQFLEDNLNSGAQGVGGSEEVDKSQGQAELIAKFANSL